MKQATARRRAALHTPVCPCRLGAMTGPPPNHRSVDTPHSHTTPNTPHVCPRPRPPALAQLVPRPHPRVPLRLAPSRSATRAPPHRHYRSIDARVSSQRIAPQSGALGLDTLVAHTMTDICCDWGWGAAEAAKHGDTPAAARPSFLRALAHATMLCDCVTTGRPRER